MKADKLQSPKRNHFWEFSIAFYQQEDVAQNLLLLQKNYGFNVNLLLYFFWLALIGEGGVSQKRTRELMHIVAPWHNKVVLPLRRLRDTLKKPSANNASLAKLREEICQEELNAEQYEQWILFEELWMASGRVRSAAQQVADICRSIASYCYLLRVKADNTLSETFNQLMYRLLPQLPLDEITKISSERLHNHPKMSKVVGTQLWLDL